jgi:hypothetical protein
MPLQHIYYIWNIARLVPAEIVLDTEGYAWRVSVWSYFRHLNGVFGWQAKSLTWEERVAVSAMAQIRITQTRQKLQDVSITALTHTTRAY